MTKKCIVEYLCGIPLHRLCSKDRPHIFPLKFGYRKAIISNCLRRKDRTLFYRNDRVASDVETPKQSQECFHLTLLLEKNYATETILTSKTI